MEHYSNNQYEDDLTVGADDYEDMLHPGDIDLFAFQDEEASPILQLKRLVLSLDWEITDEVLLSIEEELIDLRDIWADDKVRLVYVQALEKIGRYIYRYKADAHRNAINVLLAMYQNLEKIVLSEELSDEDVMSLLKSDIAKFEKLKRLIFSSNSKEQSTQRKASAIRGDNTQNMGQELQELVDLKAIVLGIDWEITEEELSNLQHEVQRLETVFAQNPVWLIFLQGIGLLGKYIRKLGSNAHSDVFGLLKSFYQGLEQVVGSSLSFAEQKTILLQEVDKFNEFKILISEKENSSLFSEDAGIVSALVGLPENEEAGFPEEDDAFFGDSDTSESISEFVDQFFDEKKDTFVASEQQSLDENISVVKKKEGDVSRDIFGGTAEESVMVTVDKETALFGVDVESEADEGIESENSGDVGEEETLAFSDEGDNFEQISSEEQLPDDIAGRIDSFFADPPGSKESYDEQDSENRLLVVPADIALQGVDVEVEGDEDEEEADSQNLEGVSGETSSTAEQDDTFLIETVADDEDVASVEEIGDADIAPALLDVAEDQDEESFAAEDAVSGEELGDEDITSALLDVAEDQDKEQGFASVEQDFPEETVRVGTGIFGSASLPGVKESNTVDNAADVSALEMLQSLENSVQSLTLDQDNSVIPEVFATIDSLHKLWAEMPLHRAYLELISVVVKHIEHYHYERSSDTLSLLLVLMENVKEYYDMAASTEKFQKSLREDMHAVLVWQQELVSTYSVENDVVSESGAVAAEVVLADSKEDDDVSFDTFITELEDIDNIVNDDAIEDDALEEALDQELENQQVIVSGDDEVTTILRQEITALRESLQQEIAELRTALNKNEE